MKKFKKMIIIVLISIVGLFIGLFVWFQIYTSELNHLKNEINQRAEGNIINPGYFSVKFHYFISGTFWNAHYRQYVESININANAKVMNFGSGPGAEAKYLANILLKENGNLTCLDISETWIDLAKIRLKNYKNVDFICGDITTMDLQSEIYDAIVIHFVLHDIPSDIRQSVIKSLAKVLEKEGEIFILEPSSEGHGIKSNEIVQLMNNAGLKLVQSTEISNIFSPNSTYQIYQKTEEF
jgi:ubiquinone/menaquinone biosynthesis C-methylase UbiE